MTELTPNQYIELDEHLQSVGWDREHCRVRWERGLPFGVYRPYPEWIGLADTTTGMMKKVTPCVVHELTHRQQRYRCKSLLAYYISLPFMRWRWEREAIKNENEAMNKLGLEF